MTEAPLRAVIAGFGFAGSRIHLPLLADAGISVVGVLANSDAAVERARGFDLIGATAADALAELEPDLVIVAVPDGAHESTLERVLPLGSRAIVIDKPVAPTSAAAERMARSAAGAGAVLVPFHNRRWDGDFLTLRSVLDAGRLGDVLRLTSRFTHWSPATGAGWRSESREGVDGWLGDLGSHLVDQLVHLLGRVEAVSAEVRSVRSPGGPNDDCFLVLRHSGGAIGHAFMSAVSPPVGARFEAQGREGTFVIDGEDPQFAQIFQGLAPGDPGWGEDAGRPNGRIVHSTTEEVAIAPGTWTTFYRELSGFLAGDAPVPVEVGDAIHGLRVLEAARLSAASGSVVEVR